MCLALEAFSFVQALIQLLFQSLFKSGLVKRSMLLQEVVVTHCNCGIPDPDCDFESAEVFKYAPGVK